jgi:RNA polymerase sigma-70 factor (ECF subfamily)
MTGDGGFHTTRWSVVLAAGKSDTPSARDALARLCEAYWYPLYAYVRRRGHDAEAAHDLTQGFFAKLLERRDLASVEEGRGRFRAYLLTAMKHHLANERDRARAQKRGGGVAPLSLDLADAEGRYGLEPGTDETPERAFERSWANTVVERAHAGLAADYADRGRASLFDALGPALAGEDVASYGEIATELGLTEGAVKIAAHRLRSRFRERLRREVAETLSQPGEVKDELLELRRALSG